jgi:hypothetical protein
MQSSEDACPLSRPSATSSRQLIWSRGAVVASPTNWLRMVGTRSRWQARQIEASAASRSARGGPHLGLFYLNNTWTLATTTA